MVKGAFLTEHLILFSGWGSWDLDVLISREVSRFIIVRKNQSNKKKRNRYIIGAGVMSCHWIFFSLSLRGIGMIFHIALVS